MSMAVHDLRLALRFSSSSTTGQFLLQRCKVEHDAMDSLSDMLNKSQAAAGCPGRARRFAEPNVNLKPHENVPNDKSCRHVYVMNAP